MSMILDLSSVSGTDSPQQHHHQTDHSTLSGISSASGFPITTVAHPQPVGSSRGSTQQLQFSPRTHPNNNNSNNINPYVASHHGHPSNSIVQHHHQHHHAVSPMSVATSLPSTTTTSTTSSSGAAASSASTATVHAHIGELPRDTDANEDNSKVGGVGIVFVEGVAAGRIGVLTLTPNGPAERQGMVGVGDLLLAVNGRSVLGMTLSQIRKMIIGRPLSKCSLTLDRPTTHTEYTVVLERESSFATKNKVVALQQDLERAAQENSSLNTALATAYEERKALLADLARAQHLAHQQSLVDTAHWTHDQQVVEALERSSVHTTTTITSNGVGGTGGGGSSSMTNNNNNNSTTGSRRNLQIHDPTERERDLERQVQRERARAQRAEDETARLGMAVDQLKQDMDTQRRHLREEAQEEAMRQREEQRKQFHQRDCLLSELNTELTRERERATNAEQEATRLSALLDDRRVEMDVVQNRILERESEIRALQREREAAITEMHRFREAVEREESNNQQSSAALRAERQRAAAAEAKLATSARAVERIQSDMTRMLAEHEEAISALRQDLQDARIDRDRAREEARQLQLPLDRAEHRIRELEAATLVLPDTSQWERTARTAQADLERERRTISNMRSELERVQSQLITAQSELQRWAQDKTSGLVETTSIQRELTSTRSEITSLEHEVARLHELREQESEAREIFAADLQRDAATAILELEQRCRDLETEIVSVESRAEATEKKLAMEAERRANAEMRCRATHERISELEDALRAANQERRMYTGDTQALDSALRRHEEALAAADARLRDSEAAHRLKDEANARLQEDIRRLLVAKEAAEREVEKVAGVVTHLTSSAQDLAIANEDLKDVAAGRIRTEAELVQHGNLLRQQQQQLLVAQQALSSAHTEIRRLEAALRLTDEGLRAADTEVKVLTKAVSDAREEGAWRLDSLRAESAQRLESLRVESAQRLEALRVESAQREEALRRRVMEEVETAHRLKVDATEKRERALLAQADLVEKREQGLLLQLAGLRDSEANARARIQEMEARFIIATDETARTQDGMKRQIDELRGQLELERRGAMEHARTSAEHSNAAIVALEDEVKRLTETVRVEIHRREKEERLSHSLSTELNSASQQMQSVTQQLHAAGQQINTLTLQVSNLSQQLAAVSQELDAAKTELARERKLRAEQAHRHMDESQRVVVAATHQIAHMERGFREVLETEKRALLGGASGVQSSRAVSTSRLVVDPLSRSFDHASSLHHSSATASDSQRGLDISRTFDAGGSGGGGGVMLDSYRRVIPSALTTPAPLGMVSGSTPYLGSPAVYTPDRWGRR